MTDFARAALATVAALTIGLTTVTPAAADWRGPPRYYRHYDRHYDRGDAAALGLFGLAAGVVAGAAIAGASQPRYYEPGYVEPDYVQPGYPVQYGPPADLAYPPAPVARTYGVTPWSPEWYRYCADRYRSFNPRNGTYIGYDNQAHFCTSG